MKNNLYIEHICDHHTDGSVSITQEEVKKRLLESKAYISGIRKKIYIAKLGESCSGFSSIDALKAYTDTLDEVLYGQCKYMIYKLLDEYESVIKQWLKIDTLYDMSEKCEFGELPHYTKLTNIKFRIGLDIKKYVTYYKLHNLFKTEGFEDTHLTSNMLNNPCVKLKMEFYHADSGTWKCLQSFSADYNYVTDNITMLGKRDRIENENYKLFGTDVNESLRNHISERINTYISQREYAEKTINECEKKINELTKLLEDEH